MSPELKALIKLAIDLVASGKAAFQKQDFVTGILPKLYAVISDIPAVAANASGIKAELEALKDPQADADLIAYVLANIAGLTSDEHAQKVIAAILVAVQHLVVDGLAIHAAIEG